MCEQSLLKQELANMSSKSGRRSGKKSGQKTSNNNGNPFNGTPLEFEEFGSLATPLTSIQVDIIRMQVYVNKCLNKLLMLNKQKQYKTFAKANEACHNAGFISYEAFEHCKVINTKGNNVKHEDVAYSLEYLYSVFGYPSCSL